MTKEYNENQRLKIAIQKKGRLHNDSLDLLARCGVKVRISDQSLVARAENMPIDILLVRDDDIPTLVMDGICDLGIVGENVLLEKELKQKINGNSNGFIMVRQLGFGYCRLSIAVDKSMPYQQVDDLTGMTIATSYPNLLNKFLADNNVAAEILELSGSVEIAPRLGMANAICDLVSTGKTLEENNLKETTKVKQSQAVLIQTEQSLSQENNELIELLLRRINGALKAQESKYIMFHAPKLAMDTIKELLPGFETPTIMPLSGIENKVAVHLVSREKVFWSTLEELKKAGASSILVLPIEKMLN